MKMIAPNIARPITKPIEEATLKTRRAEQLERDDRLRRARLLADEEREQDDARRSPRPTIVGEPQAYSLPPQVVTRISALTPAVSSIAPR